MIEPMVTREPATAYQIVARRPTLAEYTALVEAVGWRPFLNIAAVEESLARSLACAVVVHDGVVVAMGRLVGDGAMYAYVQDLAVAPDHQHRGLGRRLLTHLLDAAADLTAGPLFVGLFSTGEATRLYEQAGFRVAPDLTGMFRQVTGRRRADATSPAG